MAIVTTASAGMKTAARATILQLRAPSATARELEQEAMALVSTSPIPVVVSSRCDVALAAGAAGVHLPESDVSVEAARGLLGDRLVGRSVHSLDSAIRAESSGADYVILGPVWESASHPSVEPIGLAALAAAAHDLRIPVLAIGGVTHERIVLCLEAGAAGYAAIRLFE